MTINTHLENWRENYLLVLDVKRPERTTQHVELPINKQDYDFLISLGMKDEE